MFLHCLLIASYEDNEYLGEKIKRGQFVSGRKKLSKETGLSEQNIRTSLAHLISTNEITIKSRPKNSLITVLSYDLYQSSDEGNQRATSRNQAFSQNGEKINQQSNQQVTSIEEENNQHKTTLNPDFGENIKGDNQQVTSKVTNNQPASNQQLTTTKEVKESKKEEERTIPSLSTFKGYAFSKDSTVGPKDVELKYEAWKENGWRDGNDKKIKNWKSKLLHTLPHMNRKNNGTGFKESVPGEYNDPYYD